MINPNKSPLSHAAVDSFCPLSTSSSYALLAHQGSDDLQAKPIGFKDCSSNLFALIYFAFQPCICCHPSPQAFLLPCLRLTYPAHAMWGAHLMRSQPPCPCWGDTDKSSALTPLRCAATAHAPHPPPDASPDMAEASRKGVLCPGRLLICCRAYNNNNNNETRWEMSACPDKALEWRPIPTTVLTQNHWDQWKHQPSAAKDSLLPCLSHFTPAKTVSF